MRNINTFDKPLQLDDSDKQTIGCRHTNPDICAKNSMPGKCALTSKTNICLTPPRSWAKKYWQLKSEN